MFFKSFAGIASSSGPAFIAAEVGGGIGGVAVIRILYPRSPPTRPPGSSSRTRPRTARRTGSPGPPATGNARRAPDGTHVASRTEE
jgi:hypothetical protein